METYRSKLYAPENVVRRYIRCGWGYLPRFRWVEVNAKSQTIREGYVDTAPEPEASKAKLQISEAFGWVEMPGSWRPPC